jgi:hypothetical protein
MGLLDEGLPVLASMTHVSAFASDPGSEAERTNRGPGKSAFTRALALRQAMTSVLMRPDALYA